MNYASSTSCRRANLKTRKVAEHRVATGEPLRGNGDRPGRIAVSNRMEHHLRKVTFYKGYQPMSELKYKQVVIDLRLNPKNSRNEEKGTYI